MILPLRFWERVGELDFGGLGEGADLVGHQVRNSSTSLWRSMCPS